MSELLIQQIDEMAKRIAELERDRDHGPMTGARAIDQQRRRADKAERERDKWKIRAEQDGKRWGE
jgi:hypothetical protein